MILNFSFNNFRSAKNDCEIDFRKINLSQHKESLINDSVLPVCVIYGPNGGGKSTIILALQYLCNLIAFPINQYRGIVGSIAPSFKPFLLDDESRNKKSEFCIVFTLDKESKVEYKYYISVLNGVIIEENLYEKREIGKPALVFNRNGNDVEIGNYYKLIKQNDSQQLNKSVPYLSLCTIILSNSPIAKVGNWFVNIGAIDFGNPTFEIALPMVFASIAQNLDIKNHMDKLLEQFNLINGYEVVDGTVNPFSGIKDKQIKTFHTVNSKKYELFFNDESMGTKKVMQAAPAISVALQSGTLVIIDELDAKLHPKLLEFIISLFTNPNVNKNGAQLLFTSHDMYTLNSNVFRRDEIWFACKDANESTLLYSLADIKDDDHRIVRSDLSFSRQYLSGRYGADPYYNKLVTWEDISSE